MPTVLAVSPHLDDAIFSAGGTLARRAREGWRVVVATVFTASVPDPRGFALACQLDKGFSPDVDYMAVRRAEDAAACAIVGAEPLCLPFAEAPHRGYDSAAALFAGLREDDRAAEHIAPALEDMLANLRPDLVLSPQAVGGHVDHAAVHLAMRSCKRRQWLWIDFPYSIRPQPRPSPFADDMAALGRRVADLDPADLRSKARAMEAYASQLGFQFGVERKLSPEIVDACGRETFAIRA